MTTTAPGTARPHAPLAGAWLLTALVVGPLGFLLYAMAERSGDRLLGAVLTGAALLSGLVAAAVLTTSGAARSWSLAASGALIALGVVAAAVVLTGPAAFVSDAYLLGLPPAVGGLVTGVLAARR